MKILIQVGDAPIEWTQVPFSELMVPACGAMDSFAGIVRNRNHGRAVEAVAYDAFAPLAEKVLREISERALLRWGGIGTVYVQHRTGKLTVGEKSVLIIVHTPHRDEAFRVCREIIEELKVKAPIWKKEFYTDGETEWLKGHALCGHQGEQRGEVCAQK